MTYFDPSRIFRAALVYAVAVAAGFTASLIKMPLPWMIGPMLSAAVLSMLLDRIHIPKFTRPVGQVVVAGTVGLSFTPAAVSAVGEQIIPMLAAALLTIVAGFVVAGMLMRLTRIDVISACLASIPGGPVEMAALAEKYGVPPGTVAFSQTMRIALLVLIVPPVIIAIDGTSSDIADLLARQSGGYRGTALMLGIAAIGSFAFRFLHINSPFFLGALGFTASASAFSLPVSMPPYWMLASAQVLLGVWLGCMFDRELLARSGKFIPAALLSTLLLMFLCVLMALCISALTGIPWQTTVLATAPGSVTEMALTSKILQQGVATVTAFHVVRLFVILPAAPLIFALTARLARGRPSGCGGECRSAQKKRDN